MANDRLYIRCKNCGTCLYLGKHFMDPFYWRNYRRDGRHLEDFLNDFFEQHCWCDQMDENDEFNSYELLYESDPDFGKKYVAAYEPSILIAAPEQPEVSCGAQYSNGAQMSVTIAPDTLSEALKSDSAFSELVTQVSLCVATQLHNFKEKMETPDNER